jgi:hypothetical protein
MKNNNTPPEGKVINEFLVAKPGETAEQLIRRLQEKYPGVEMTAAKQDCDSVSMSPEEIQRNAEKLAQSGMDVKVVHIVDDKTNKKPSLFKKIENKLLGNDEE